MSVGFERGTMPFMAHLAELRRRMLRSTGMLTVGFFVAWAYHVEIYEWLSAPVRNAMADHGLFAIKALQITESISVYMKLSLIAGSFLMSPYLFYQIWAFIAPGLLDKEKRVMTPVITASVAFFVAGAFFCYAVVLPFMTSFLIEMTIEASGMSLEPTLQSTVNYSMWLLLAFGIVFELPVFMYFLSALNLVTAAGLWAFYRYWIVLAFIIGAVLTPTPDPLNQALMGGPLVILYGLGVIIAWLVEQDRAEGSRLPKRGAVVLLLVLGASGAWATGRLVETRGREPVADVPANVHQLVGLHSKAWPRLAQSVTSSSVTKGLGLLRLVEFLKIDGQPAQTLWLARFNDGAALIMRHPNAQSVVEQIATARAVSKVPYAGGQSALFTLPGAREHWRVCAPQGDVLWIGHDQALARLAQVRQDGAPALVDDAKVVNTLDALRSKGPMFSLSVAPDGVRRWLPDGALGEKVDAVAAWIGAKHKVLHLQLDCKGFEGATALRDRLEVWAAARRQSVGRDIPGAREVKRLASRIGALAQELGRLAAVTSQLLPDEGPHRSTTLKVSRQALVIAREVVGVQIPTEQPTGPLVPMVVPPSIHRIEAQKTTVRWRIESTPDIVVGGLLAASDEGLDPALLETPGPKDANAKTQVGDAPGGRAPPRGKTAPKLNVKRRPAPHVTSPRGRAAAPQNRFPPP